MTTSTEWFLSTVNQAVRDVGELVPGISRLLRLAERGYALERALRVDPGHGITGVVVSPGDDRTKAVQHWVAMGKAMLASTGPFEPGVCRVCGCTRVTACDVPTDYGSTACGWALADRTLCDNPDCVIAYSNATGIETAAPEGGGTTLELTEAYALLAANSDAGDDVVSIGGLDEITNSGVLEVYTTASIACTDVARTTGLSTGVANLGGSTTVFSSGVAHYTLAGTTTED